MVRIALQIPIHAMSQSYHTVANRYELHRCRCTAYLLISFLQRLISQDYGYVPPFFEVLHFYKTSLLCEIMHSTFADTRHLRSLRTRFPDLLMTSFKIQVTINNHASTSDFFHGTLHTMLVQLIRMFFDENTHAVANFYNYFGDAMPSLNLRFTTGSDPTLTGFSVPFRLRSNFPFPRFGSRKASGNTCYVHI